MSGERASRRRAWRVGALVGLGLLALHGAARAETGSRFDAPTSSFPPAVSALALDSQLDPWSDDALEPVTLLVTANPYVVAPAVEIRLGGGKDKEKTDKPRATSTRRPRRSARSRASTLALTPERAQALLRSVTVPGWGQATLGHRTAGTVFGIIESGVWGSFLAFRIQEHLRRDASTRTARIYAGIDLAGRDEEMRRLVGAFASSDEYNLLVVSRDAANLYYDEPDRYRDYIAQHSLGGSNAWSWRDAGSFFRYQAQRKDAQRAALRANTALAAAVGNRILSVLHVARVANRAPGATGAPRSWNLEVVPAGGDDPTEFRFGLRTHF
jgi:hypothetical protein